MSAVDLDTPESPGVRGGEHVAGDGRCSRSGRCALGAVAVVSLASPEPARAIPINPLDPLDDILGAGVDAITGGIGGMATEALEAIFKALFAWPAKMINRELLGWLVAVPDYAIHPETARAAGDGSNLAQLGATTSAMGFAALGAVATVSGIRYWAAGLTGSGGLEALEGLGRTVGAALFIVLWPWLFRHAADLANEAGSGLLGSGSVLDDTARLLAVAFAAGVAFNILAILIAIGAAVLFLMLLLTKIVVSATTALVFVGMPLAVMLWPVPELAWIARTAMRAFAVVLAIPLLWAVCFATFAAVGIDALALKGAGKVVDALVMPLVALALLWVTVVAPRSLARMAMFGAQGGGFVGTCRELRRRAARRRRRRAEDAGRWSAARPASRRAGAAAAVECVGRAAPPAVPAPPRRAPTATQRPGRQSGDARPRRQPPPAARRSAAPAAPLDAARRLRAGHGAGRRRAVGRAAQSVVAGDQGPRAGRARRRRGARAGDEPRRRRPGDAVAVAARHARA